MTRIYTRTGDQGTTGLVGGQRIDKDAPRIEAFGTLDELSSAIGIARSELRTLLPVDGANPVSPLETTAARLNSWLAWTQDILFNLGSELATLPKDRWENMPQLALQDVEALERAIDEAQAMLPPLAQFIHPGGCKTGSVLHLSRTICRRAERLIVGLGKTEPISESTAQWINRLSDALFVWARWINHACEEPETLWTAKTSPPT